MKKFILSLFLVISLLFLQISYNISFSVHSFSTDNVLKNIDYFSSSRFKGRLPGTLENDFVAYKIKDNFKKIGLKPLGNDYFQPFTVEYPKKIDGKPVLNILDKKGKIIKEYTYGKDYKEDMVNFKKNSFTFSKKDKIMCKDSFIHIDQGENSFLIYSPKDNDINFRSSFFKDASEAMYIEVTGDCLKDMESNVDKGYTVKCFIPFVNSSIKVNNVCGYIKGKDSSAPPLVISAHFDHVGSDLNGNVYNGALDNASGLSFVQEMAAYVSSLPTPECDIVFAAFNAEEYGCLGSKYFAESHRDYLKNAKVINFDMIGGGKDIPLYIMGGEKDNVNTPFVKELSYECRSQKLNFSTLFSDASDHEYFRKNNISAITLCDNDTSRIHTLKDRVQYIDTFGINRCQELTRKEIVLNGFNDNLLIIYYKEVSLISLVSVLILSLFYRLERFS